MKIEKVLLVDDDPDVRWMLVESLKEWGYEPIEAQTYRAALFAFETEAPAAVLLDIDLPDGSGLNALREIKAQHPHALVIMITAKTYLENAIEALRGGAYDFICKPVNLAELQVTLHNALETRRLRKKIHVLRNQQARQFSFDQLIGDSPAWQELLTLARRVSQSEVSAVLLQGASGTGKELVARAMHYGSPRAEGPFVAINCAAIPATLLESELFGHEKGAFTDAKHVKEGLFEQAEGGTLFLDEIGELEMGLQAKLLRVLEEGCFRRVGGLKDMPYDARIVAASNRDLRTASAAGEFRSDLFYRLSVIQLELPPLRARGDDVLILANYFIWHFNHQFKKHVKGLSLEVAKLFEHYAWPGNVRELRNVIERVMILEDGDWITTSWLPRDLLAQASAQAIETKLEVNATAPVADHEAEMCKLFPLPIGGVSLDEVEKSLLLQAIQQAKGNRTRAARLLRITRDQYRYRLKKLNEGAVRSAA